MPRRKATPSDSRIMAKHSYEFLTLGLGAISQGRGVETPKGMDQLEIVARRRSSRSGCKTKSCQSSSPRHPRGDCVVPEGGFLCNFLHHVEDSGPSHHYTIKPTAGGAASAAAAQPRIAADGGGGRTGS